MDVHKHRGHLQTLTFKLRTTKVHLVESSKNGYILKAKTKSYNLFL